MSLQVIVQYFTHLLILFTLFYFTYFIYSIYSFSICYVGLYVNIGQSYQWILMKFSG